MKLRKWILRAQYGFLLAGAVALGYCAGVWVTARLYQARESRRFDQELRLGTRIPRSPSVQRAARILAEGEVVGRLEIPRLGVSVMVVEGDRNRDLRRAVGHIPGTALPGTAGNVAIAGHRDTFFRPLGAIRRNDTIMLSTLKGAYRYHVVSTKVVKPEDTQVLDPARRDTLTLVTCYPFDYLGAAPLRFIVRARRWGA